MIIKTRHFCVAVCVLALISCGGAVQPDLTEDWAVVLESLDSTRNVLSFHPDEAGERIVRTRGKQCIVTYPSVGGKNIEVSFTYEKGNDYEAVTPKVVNREEGWVVLTLAGPERKDLGVDVKKMDLLVPNGGGIRYDFTQVKSDDNWTRSKDKKYYEARFAYAGHKCDMQWFEFFSGSENLYIACHDPEFRWKTFRFQYYPAEGRIAFRQEHRFTCFPGETWNGPATQIARLEGSWRSGADRYQAWFRSVKKVIRQPQWLKASSGWLLTILRQQNGQMIWSYPEVGTTLVDAAERRGLDILALYGWTVGGHDRFYPDYEVSEEMGGEEALKTAFAQIHARGKRAILYINGQLIDRNGTQFWADTGQFIARVGKTGQFQKQQYIKFDSTGPRTFGVGCYHDPRWRNRMLNIAKKAKALGADGVIYDQLGGHNTNYCYGEGHGHRVPAVAYNQDRMEFLEWASGQMKAIDPDFIIMTEALQDCELGAIEMFHGWSVPATKGVKPEYIRRAIDKDGFMTLFPDAFHYVFPDAQATLRYSTPAMMRGAINFGTTFGYRHEIECRYQPDKWYLLEDRIPTKEDYADVHSTPFLKTVQEYDPAELIAYGKAVMDLRRKYEDLLYKGVYRADEGFSIETEAPYLIGRAFVSGKKMGVVVWNVSDEGPADYTVIPDKGWTLQETAAPEGIPAEGPLPAQSIRLLVFVKQ